MVMHPDTRIVVTRPQQQSQSWINKIQAAGMQHLYIPMLTISPVGNDKTQAIKDIVMALDEYSFAIFVSQNAVAYGFDWIEEYWPQFPQDVICLSVGKKTHDAVNARLDAYSCAAVDYGDTRMNSEELLEMDALQNVRDKKIVIFRGCGGRTKLFDMLQARGAEVQHCELYERRLPKNALAELSRNKLNAERDILTIFSGETLINIQKLLLTAKVPNWQLITIVVPSERVKILAGELGFKRVETAINATEDSMWQALDKCLSVTK
ncbi:uroporphyrinogen-III synthase [Agarilytica rhodophyticola]|uniref:uroporphyrinogen-III synthase n=1 Tax=Agarilytica rhodophyticola TaxID=1737490 RepID=UPI000B341FD3|nr:uroporphyrinogen-III synthase [Agarilytica rhodophyticola]